MQRMTVKNRAMTQMSNKVEHANTSCDALSTFSGTPTTATRKQRALIMRDDCSATAKLEKLKAIYQKKVTAVTKAKSSAGFTTQ